ncbi:MAG: RagB/SusD family nutrient uptake outer membrane protein [Chitinophagaceae bacterium]|nr:RagB/SusD family nutrient uptake outer membrane protein [Chitinophagaceae bacterium]
MKRIYIIPAILIFFAFSCQKLVEPKVYSVLTEDNAFITRDDAVAAVNAVYSRLKQPSGRSDSWMYYAGFQVTISDLTTDEGHASSGGDVGLMSDCQWSSSNTYLAFAWQHQYKLVSDANNGLYYIPKMEKITDEEKTQFVAELKFLRALGYVDLTDAFGPVILMTEDSVAKNIQSPDYESKPSPSSVEDVNKVIISDLEYAAQHLPVNYEDNAIYSTNDVGRASKGSALTLLAKLYMREHEWQKVVDITAQIQALNQYSLYPSYAGLFAEKNKWCSENIFSALANALNDGVEIMNHFGPVNNPQVTDRWGYFGATWYFWNTFALNDDRREMFYYDYIGTDGLHYMQAPPGQTTPPDGYYYMPDVSTKKYADPNGSTTYYDGHVFPILRYADVLLSRAEALNEINGPTKESVDLINEVKGRSHATLLGVASTFTKESLRDAIVRERGWEFFFECKRRQDLIRTGKYQDVVNTYLVAIGKSAIIDINKNKYFPYPQAQVDLNPNLSNADR